MLGVEASVTIFMADDDSAAGGGEDSTEIAVNLVYRK